MYPYNAFDGGFGLMGSLFPVIFFTIFAVTIVAIVVSVVKGAQQFGRNNASPVLTVDCAVVAKRTSVSRHHHTDSNNMMMGTTSTSYYVTFQVESGDRMEFSVSGREYGMLAEGDRGKLTFQGTRYKGFVREP